MKHALVYLISALIVGLCLAVALSLRYQTTVQGSLIYMLDRWTGEVQVCAGAKCVSASVPATNSLLTRISLMLPEFIVGKREEPAPPPPPPPPPPAADPPPVTR